MKPFLLFSMALAIFPTSLFSQSFPIVTQSWAADQLGTADGVDVVTDNAGQTYVVGNYDNEVFFDATMIGGTYGTMFVAKYDQMGNVKWVRPIYGNSNNRMVAVDIDLSGNLYVTGQYEHTNTATILDFGTFSVSGNGSESTFIAKIDTAGDWQWVNTMLSTGPSPVNGKQVRPYDLVWTTQGPVIAGRVEEQVTIDNTTFNDINDNTFYFAQFHVDGDLTWFYQGTGLAYDFRLHAANNSVFFVGNAHDDVTYGGSSFDQQGAGDVFFGAINLNGGLIWGDLAGHFSYNEISKDISLDQDNNVYLTFGNPAYVQIGDSTVSRTGDANWYLYKFNSVGDFQWMKPLSYSASGYTYNHLTTPTGTTYVTGFVESPSFFEPVHFWSDSVGGFGAKEAFFAAYRFDGSFLDVTGFVFEDGGNPTYMGEFIPREMRFDHQGKIAMTGTWNEAIIIGDDTLVNDAWPHTKQMFLLKADPNQLFDLAAGIDHPLEEGRFSVYPNPSTGQLFVEGSLPAKTSYRIFNSMGALLLQGDLTGNQAPIDVNDMPAGVYFLHLYGEDGSRVLPFIRR